MRTHLCPFMSVVPYINGISRNIYVFLCKLREHGRYHTYCQSCLKIFSLAHCTHLMGFSLLSYPIVFRLWGRCELLAATKRDHWGKLFHVIPKYKIFLSFVCIQSWIFHCSHDWILVSSNYKCTNHFKSISWDHISNVWHPAIRFNGPVVSQCWKHMISHCVN